VPKDFIPEHKELFQACDIRNQIVLCSAFRHFGKSTIASFIDLLHKICHNFAEFIVIGSYNLKIAKQFTKAIKDQLETNQLLREDYGVLVGESQWQAEDFTTANGVRVLAIGSGTSLRGKIDLKTGVRPDCVVIDDLETDDTARSAYQSGNLIDWLFKGVYPALRLPESGGACFRIMGTPITPVSVITTLTNDIDRAIAKLRYSIFKEDGTTPRWPALFSPEEIARIRRDAGVTAWFSEYLLSPLSSAFQLFQGKWLRYVDVEQITDWDRTVAACDPSFTKFGDFKAIIVVGLRKSDNRVYVRYVWCRQETVESLLKAIHDIQKTYDCDVWIEDNTIKDFLYTAIKAYEKRHKVHLRVRGIQHSNKKEKRIETLQSPFERGLIVLPESSHSDVSVLIEQLLPYPTGKYDDAVDALAEAYNKVFTASRRPAVLQSTPPQEPSSKKLFSPSSTRFVS